MRKVSIIALVVGLLVGLAGLAIVSAQDDIIITAGPRADIQKLYRSFDGGAYEAETVSLAPFDETTGAALTIDTVHHEVHEGESFHGEYTNASAANNSSVDLVMRTGAADAHTVFEVFAGGQVTIYLYETPVFTTTGTAVAVYNMKRSAAITSTVAISHTPTVSATGSIALVNGRILPGGTSPQTRVGGGIRSGAEWILKPNTNYLLRATNTSGSNVAINVVTEWYEED